MVEYAVQPGKVKSHSAQFWREADMLASLNHPSVLHLYGVVVDNHHERNVVGIMTEYMRGGSLSAALRYGSLTPQALLGHAA